MTPGETAWVQRRLGLPADGVSSAELIIALRNFQRAWGLVITGEVDGPTRHALASLATEGLLPRWYGTEIADTVVASRIGGSDEDSIRRFQSAAGLPLTGVVDEETARRIGD